MGGCQANSPEELKAIKNEEERPSLIMKEYDTAISDSGRVKYRFITPLLLQYDKKEDPYIDFPEGLHFLIYNNHSKVEAQVKCKIGRYYSEKKLWELNDDVEAINKDAQVLNTEQLFWDMEKKYLYSDKFVKITSASEVITGTGFESKEDLSDYTIKNPGGSLEIKK